MSALSKKQRTVLFAMFDGLCAYCGQPLPEKGWHADHIEPLERNGEFVRLPKPMNGATHKYVQDGTCRNPHNERVENYYPSCRACNINKGASPLELWRSCLERSVEGIRRDHASYRHAERFGLVAQITTKVVFHFEKLQLTGHLLHHHESGWSGRLHSCPFCGSDRLLMESRSSFIFHCGCIDCCCDGPLFSTPEEAARMWNERATMHA